MTSGTWLDHKELKIIKGIGKTPGDIYSAEPDPVIVNLMAGPITLYDWTPEIAQVKNGGVWVDSPLNDGRELLAAAAGNVIEKITVVITDSSYLGAMKALSGLNQMANDCRDYWQTGSQIDPIYLAWWAGCGVGTQYALLSNIEVSPDYQDSINPTIRVSVALEREPYWRGIPPGANPKIWTYYVNASHPQFNFSVASLVTGSDHLITQTIQNKFEWSPTAYGLQTTPLSQNYIDIAAALVPGDAPALVEASINNSGNNQANVYIGCSSKKYSGTGHDGVFRANSLILNAGDGNTASVVTKVNTGSNVTGVLSNGSSVIFYQGQRTVTGIDANFVTAVGWGGPTGANGIKLDREMYRGTFAIFCRANNGSAAPVTTDMRMRVFIEEFEDNAANQCINSITLPDVYPPNILGSSGAYQLTYMGTVTLPLSTRTVQSPLGYGIQLQEANSNLRISVQVKVDVATANRIFDILDLVLMPVDECMAQVAITNSTSSTASKTVLDNTGYLTRGEIKQSAITYITNANSGGVNQEVRGQDITLKPRTDQRLYIISELWDTNVLRSRPDDTVAVRLNIVPRWAGIRDT